MKLKIGTINCQNNEENRSGKSNNSYFLAEHIINNNYDIVGTQELTIRFSKRLSSFLSQYNIYGSYQYGKGLFGTKFPIIKSFNQANQIITRYNSLSSKTKSLPWFPRIFNDLRAGLKKKSITRRIYTVVKLSIEDEYIYVINTHLDYYITEVQQRQLDFLYKKIYNYTLKGKVILMGDFNLTIDDDIFSDFINKLNKIGIKRVPVNDKTNALKYRQKSAIDHIFIPNDFSIIECGITDIDYITDHKAVFAFVDTKENI